MKKFLLILFWLAHLHADPGVYPPSIENSTELIDIAFDSIRGDALTDWITHVFGVTFLTTDLVQNGSEKSPLAKSVFSFTSSQKMSKKEIWDLFLQWLNFLSLYVVPGHTANTFIIKNIPSTNAHHLIPTETYFNTPWQKIPASSSIIRYLYTFKQVPVSTFKNLISECKSAAAYCSYIEKLNTFIITDNANNIRSLMHILQSIDLDSTTETVSVIKLRNTDAQAIVKLYESLTEGQGQKAATTFTAAKESSFYFSPGVRIIPEARNNLVILIGSQTEVSKVEEFIITHLDVVVSSPNPPIHVYELKHALADDIAKALDTILKKKETEKKSSIPSLTHYLDTIHIQAEAHGNKLIITAEQQAYDLLVPLIKTLDIKQKQIIFNVLLINLTLESDKELGSQIRNKDATVIGNRVDFQTSGLPLSTGPSAPVVDDPQGLMANLITLASAQQPGATLISVRGFANGVWSLFKMLDSYANVSLLSNPFLVTVHKKPAKLQLGEVRRVTTNTFRVVGDFPIANPSFADLEANLKINIVPRINQLEMIDIDLALIIDNFTEELNPLSANKTIRSLYTHAQLKNGEILAIGGIPRMQQSLSDIQVPILGQIPVIKWFFSSDTQQTKKDHLLILVSAQIIEDKKEKIVSASVSKIDDCKEDLAYPVTPNSSRDPIHRHFFQDKPIEEVRPLDAFIEGVHILTPIKGQDTLACVNTCGETHSQQLGNSCKSSRVRTSIVPKDDTYQKDAA